MNRTLFNLFTSIEVNILLSRFNSEFYGAIQLTSNVIGINTELGMMMYFKYLVQHIVYGTRGICLASRRGAGEFGHI